MPLPMIILVGIFFGVSIIGAAGSVTVVALHHKQAKKKLKYAPNGVPRPPPGMARNELKQAAQEKLQMNVTNYFNFGFCGGSGAGT